MREDFKAFSVMDLLFKYNDDDNEKLFEAQTEATFHI